LALAVQAALADLIPEQTVPKAQIQYSAQSPLLAEGTVGGILRVEMAAPAAGKDQMA
jgi:hypothetical protein